MPLRVFITILLCTLIMTPAKSTGQDSEIDHTDETTSSTAEDVEDYAIDKFMNTSLEIWVLNTTQQNPHNCQKDLPYNMTGNTTFFFRSHEEGHNITNESLAGHFEKFAGTEKVYNQIALSGGSSHVHAEFLFYATKNLTCGLVRVFAFVDGYNVMWDDLRVKGRPTNLSDIKECTEEFNKYVDAMITKNWTSPYNASCK
ncbi:uncharacterized protein LOC142787028 [Rhipicephalus microplus]|uniref:uncharacterized protein LOC142787028 n=1 Tax=Rhipicephalus microplus TaxID=6941 RepID=UPI003F6AFFC9